MGDVARYAAMGAHGLKMHPRRHGAYEINDKALVYPILEQVADHEMIVLFHTGEAHYASAGLLRNLARMGENMEVMLGLP